MGKSKFLNELETILKEREIKYGNVDDNFYKIARLWSAYLEIGISKKDVACMMGLLKIARISTGIDNKDNWLDTAGYAVLGCEVENG